MNERDFSYSNSLRRVVQTSLPSRRPLVGIVGKAGAGKSTAALLLTTLHGYQKHPFAKALKEMTRVAGFTHDQVYGDLSAKEQPVDWIGDGTMTSRRFQQIIGTEFMRDLIDKDGWVKIWKRTMPTGLVVVDDCRFLNEAETIKAMGGLLIRIARVNPNVDPNEKHPSEVEQESITADFHLDNNGDMAQLQSRLHELTLLRGPDAAS